MVDFPCWHRRVVEQSEDLRVVDRVELESVVEGLVSNARYWALTSYIYTPRLGGSPTSGPIRSERARGLAGSRSGVAPPAGEGRLISWTPLLIGSRNIFRPGLLLSASVAYVSS